MGTYATRRTVEMYEEMNRLREALRKVRILAIDGVERAESWEELAQAIAEISKIVDQALEPRK